MRLVQIFVGFIQIFVDHIDIGVDLLLQFLVGSVERDHFVFFVQIVLVHAGHAHRFALVEAI